MSTIDNTLLVETFFISSIVVFVIALYIILPGLIYNKRTMLRPKLINAMWHRLFGSSIGKLRINRHGLKKKESIGKVTLDYLLLESKMPKNKIKTGLY